MAMTRSISLTFGNLGTNIFRQRGLTGFLARVGDNLGVQENKNQREREGSERERERERDRERERQRESERESGSRKSYTWKSRTEAFLLVANDKMLAVLKDTCILQAIDAEGNNVEAAVLNATRNKKKERDIATHTQMQCSVTKSAQTQSGSTPQSNVQRPERNVQRLVELNTIHCMAYSVSQRSME